MTGPGPDPGDLTGHGRAIRPYLNPKVKLSSEGFRLPSDRSRKESTARETEDIREDDLLTQEGPTDRA